MNGKSKLWLWLELAMRRSVVVRALLCALIVGTILIIINHGPRLICFDVTEQCVFQMLLTYCVPYAVSTYSSVQAMIGQCQDLASQK